MDYTPVISFIGWSGCGKTTFLEKLIPVLRAEGLRLAVVKHDGHDFQMDREGKDTWRFTRAGAECVAIANGRHAAILDARRLDFNELCARAGDVDLILSEGWNIPCVPKIEVLRGRSDLRCDTPDELIALITDQAVDMEVPVFDPAAVDAVADFMLGWLAQEHPCLSPYAALRAGADPSLAEVSLSIGGQEISLLPFVQRILRSVNMGVIDTLKDTGAAPGSEVCIRFKT